MKNKFHLAFPVNNLSSAKIFYRDLLGCELGRESKSALIINLGGHQLVAHLVSHDLPHQESIYPRHFGLIIEDKEAFDTFVARLKSQSVSFEVPLKIRYQGSILEHYSFFLKDPSHNLLEFKHYTNSAAIFGKKDYHQIGESDKD